MTLVQFAALGSPLPVSNWLLVLVAILIGLASLALGASSLFARRDRPWPVREAATWAFSMTFWIVPIAAVVCAVGYFATEKLNVRHDSWKREVVADDAPEVPTAVVPEAIDESKIETTEVATIDPSRSAPPAWTREPSVSEGETTWVVRTSGQFATVAEAEADVVADAGALIREDFERRYGQRGDWTIPDSFVWNRAVSRRHEEKLVRGSDDSPFLVRKLHVLVELSPAVARELYPVWRSQVLGERLQSLGALFGMLTLVFGTSTAYLRLDGLTDGAYRRRLKFASVGVIVAGGLLALLVLA